MSQFPTNQLNEFSDAMKEVYATRDNVHTQEEFERIANRTCINCAPDAPMMPHQEKVCPLAYKTTTAARSKVGAMRAERAQQRILENLDRLKTGKPAAYCVTLDMADEYAVYAADQ